MPAAHNVTGMLAILLAASTVIGAPSAFAGIDALAPVEQTLELSIDPRHAPWQGTFGASLAVRHPTRDVLLRFAGPTITRVEMRDAEGRVDLVWGMRGADSLRIETRRPLRPGRAELAVSFEGVTDGDLPGLARDETTHRVRLADGAGRVFPAWPGRQPATPWTLILHVPRGNTVRSILARVSLVPWRGWITLTARSRSTLGADQLRFQVEPVPVRARGR